MWAHRLVEIELSVAPTLVLIFLECCWISLSIFSLDTMVGDSLG